MKELSLIFPSSPFLIEQDVFPPLGILYLTSCLQSKGIKVHCYDMGIGHTPDMVKTEYVGISLLTAQKNEGLELIKYFKEQGKYVIVGGPHATHKYGDCYKAGADLVINGYDLRLLFGRFGITLLPDEFIHFNDFPFPDRNALPIKDYKYKINGKPATTLMTSRNCFGNCSFCGKIPGSMQLRTARSVVSEIEKIHEDFGYEAFMIFDDVFTASKRRLQQIADFFCNTGFLFRCFSRTDLLNEEICRALKKMGVVEVGLGIESGSKKVLEKNIKGTSPDMNTKAVKMLHDYGIRAKAFLIIGLPGETKQTIEETEKWILEAKPDDVDFSIFKPMPGSPIYNNPKKFGIEFDPDDTFWYKGTPGKYETTVKLNGLVPEELLFYRNLLEEKYKKWN